MFKVIRLGWRVALTHMVTPSKIRLDILILMV
jgi:hypothetical protein